MRKKNDQAKDRLSSFELEPAVEGDAGSVLGMEERCSRTEPAFGNLLRSLGIDTQPGGIDSCMGTLNVYKYGLWQQERTDELHTHSTVTDI
jgi:hypothetical protein